MCKVNGDGCTNCVSKCGGIGPLCHKMRRYGPTLQIREGLRLDSLCPVDDEGGAHCVSKMRGYRPTVS